jgi:hypothetical protein
MLETASCTVWYLQLLSALLRADTFGRGSSIQSFLNEELARVLHADCQVSHHGDVDKSEYYLLALLLISSLLNAF